MPRLTQWSQVAPGVVECAVCGHADRPQFSLGPVAATTWPSVPSSARAGAGMSICVGCAVGLHTGQELAERDLVAMRETLWQEADTIVDRINDQVRDAQAQVRKPAWVELGPRAYAAMRYRFGTEFHGLNQDEGDTADAAQTIHDVSVARPSSVAGGLDVRRVDTEARWVRVGW